MSRAALILALFALTSFAPHKKPYSQASFNAISDGKKVFVTWTASNDRDYDYFTIEKSKDGINFTTTLMVKGTRRIGQEAEYFDIDYVPFSGISYYRLKQTDYFGDVSYSDIIPVNFQYTKDGNVIERQDADPGPQDLAEIENREILVVLRDAKGQEYVTKVLVASDGTQLIATDKRNKVSQGTYNVVASSYNSIYSRKLTVK